MHAPVLKVCIRVSSGGERAQKEVAGVGGAYTLWSQSAKKLSNAGKEMVRKS